MPDGRAVRHVQGRPVSDAACDALLAELERWKKLDLERERTTLKAQVARVGLG